MARAAHATSDDHGTRARVRVGQLTRFAPLARSAEENSCAFRGGGVSAPKAAAMSAYNYVVSAQKPTNVTHAVMGNFTAPDA